MYVTEDYRSKVETLKTEVAKFVASFHVIDKIVTEIHWTLGTSAKSELKGSKSNDIHGKSMPKLMDIVRGINTSDHHSVNDLKNGSAVQHVNMQKINADNENNLTNDMTDVEHSFEWVNECMKRRLILTLKTIYR